MSKYTADHQPTIEELDALHKFFVHAAGEAEARTWEDLYFDAADVIADVISAWRGELDL